ncbi:hypothetical protein D3C72_1344630 [compost metagenome]
MIDLGVESALLHTLAFTAFRLAEVDTTGQFTYAQNIETAGGDVGRQRAELFQPLIQASRAQVAEQFEVLAQGQQGTAFRLFCRRQVFPFRATY